DEKLALDGRLVIAGYEEDAMPRYYTFFDQPIIDDEASRKNDGGWSRKLHNCFGFVTAYFFKDCACSQHCKHFFHHINVDSIALFNKFATVFQKHAFGKALPEMDRTHDAINKKIGAGDVYGVLNELVRFWSFLYDRDVKIGNFQLAATQDILFSIEYARHLMRSPVPLLSYYTGPDITYPIEVTAKQKKEATKNAQDFVRVFAQQLQPREGKKTVYVFCSFVDGVGKSTLLGNVKNLVTHGDDISAYDHVDNSSSQLATLFQYNPKVFIADLPAQVSHFTYKPDGDVFVDAYTEHPEREVIKIRQWYNDHKAEIDNDYAALLDQVKYEIALHGYFAPSLQDRQRPDKAFARNVILLKRGDNWVPFTYEGNYYLLNRDRPVQVNCLISLGLVKSDGLKNIEAQQMLFFDGIRFPYPYDYFLNNFVDLLKAQGIEKVVFVDSLSMYPRSSRENIRINYLLQQQALLDATFDYSCSFYKDFTGGGELLYCLQNRRQGMLFRQGMVQEALVRMALYDLIIHGKQTDLEGTSVQRLTERLETAIKQVAPNDLASIKTMVDKKISHHTKVLEQDYGLSKQFVNVQLSSIHRIIALSELLQTFFTTVVRNEPLNTLYEKRRSPYAGKSDAEQGLLDSIEKAQDGTMMRVYYKIGQTCKDPMLLTAFIRMLRANWYALVADLFFKAKQSSWNNIEINELLFRVVPVVVEQADDGYVYITQHFLEPYSDKIDPEKSNSLYLSNRIFKLKKQNEAEYGDYKKQEYRLAWACEQTSKMLYGYATSIEGKNDIAYGDEEESILSYFLQNYQKEHSVHTVIPTSQLLAQTQSEKGKKLWAFTLKDLGKIAQKNGLYSHDDKEREEQKKAKPQRRADGTRELRVFIGLPEDKPRLQIIVRLLATLEMVAKDPEANIVVRYGNHDDFTASLKLFEKTILPYYYGVLYQEDLFDDYDHVEPYPSWEFWDTCDSD
ncbi:MAG: hypothetical protein WCT20_01225, partial [Candidatus Babeliales bacterium]